MASSEVVGSVLFGADHVVSEFVRVRIPHMRDQGFGPLTALGVIRDGQLIGGAVYHGYVKHDVQVSVAMDVPALSRATLRMLFAYPFNQLGCVRITAIIAKKNKKAREGVERMGFRLEGVVRKAIDGKDDACVYGMLRDECKWLRNEHGTRQIDAPAASNA